MDEWTRKFVSLVEGLAEPLLASEGLNLIDVEYRREGRGWVLRVFIDKEGGVTLDDCAIVSHRLGNVIDASMDREEPYHLEISSPGLDRPLTKPRHFVCFQGRSVIVRTKEPVQGKRDFKGVLSEFSEGLVKLAVADRTVDIEYENILKARLDWKPL